jgi:hypothetical protein
MQKIKHKYKTLNDFFCVDGKIGGGVRPGPDETRADKVEKEIAYCTILLAQ